MKAFDELKGEVENNFSKIMEARILAEKEDLVIILYIFIYIYLYVYMCVNLSIYQDSCLVLVRDCAGVPEHVHRGSRALQPARLAHRVPL